ncbi:MAG: hypothetical protein MJ232_09145 [archaeon]|nr:hypothetical protein [archaeon]
MKHVFTNALDADKGEMIYAIKHNGRVPIKYEKLSASLIAEINEITDDDIKNFHYD